MPGSMTSFLTESTSALPSMSLAPFGRCLWFRVSDLRTTEYRRLLPSREHLIEQRVIRYRGNVDRRRDLLLAVRKIEIFLHVLDVDLAVEGKDRKPLVVNRFSGFLVQLPATFNVVDHPVSFFAAKCAGIEHHPDHALNARRIGFKLRVIHDQAAGWKVRRQLIGRADLPEPFLRHDHVMRARQNRRRHRALAEACDGVRDRTTLSENYLFGVSAFVFQHQPSDEVLQTADAIDTDSLAGKVAGPLHAGLGDKKKRRLTQRNHDALQRRALSRGDNASRIPVR